MGPGWVLEKVISGLQTGVDQVALEVARALGYQTGGTAPKGFRTDNGPRPDLAAHFGVTAHWSPQYGPRTKKNVYDADATVWFGYDSAGWVCTANAIATHRKPYRINPSVAELQDFILKHGIKVLNVAGNRLRTHPESSERARVVLTAGLLPF